MSEILSLKPEDEMSLHPEAVRWYNARVTEINFEVPLQELTDDDLNAFLSDEEKHEFKEYMDEITKGLRGCIINKDAAPSNPVTNANIDLSLAIFQASALWPMHGMVVLLKHVHQRKVEKAKQEQRERDEEDKRRREQAEAERRRKEEEERWRAACKAVNPPRRDDERYLNPREYEKFSDSVLEAIDAYLAKGKSYILDKRAGDYLAWISVIDNGRKKEQEKITAELAAQKYNQQLNKEIVELKAVLCSSKKDLNIWFKKEIGDKRYSGHNFDYVLSTEKKGSFDSSLVSVVNKRLEQLIPKDLHQFVDTTPQYHRIYFPLPLASYSFEGMPCLDFYFDIFATAYAEVWLRPGEKTLGGYVFNLPWREEKGYSVVLQGPELLGYYYIVLPPGDFGGYVFWQSIPLVLIQELLRGETKLNGATISAASDSMITYKIPKFKGEVTIPDSFADYLRSVGSIDEMVSIGVMTQKLASIAKGESDKIAVEGKASPSGEKGGDSKKARAFHLFSQGKGPSSPEVKLLGLHKSTRFKYYNQYLETHKP